MKPDAIISVRFLLENEGGRQSAITGHTYGCPLMIDDHGFDCRFVLDGSTTFELGKEYEIGIKFLCVDLALNELEEGSNVTLWEGRTIAKGVVKQIL